MFGINGINVLAITKMKFLPLIFWVVINFLVEEEIREEEIKIFNFMLKDEEVEEKVEKVEEMEQVLDPENVVVVKENPKVEPNVLEEDPKVYLLVGCQGVLPSEET